MYGTVLKNHERLLTKVVFKINARKFELVYGSVLPATIHPR